MTRTPERSRSAISLAFMSLVTKRLEIGQHVRPMRGAQLVDQRRVLDDVRAVVDALGADVVQHGADVVDAADLVDVAVHRQAVAELAGAGEHVGELLRRVAALVGVEADAEDPVPVGMDASSVSAALSALWSRTKHMMRSASMPRDAPASAARW